MNAPEVALVPTADAAAGDCFHCGLPVPSQTRFRVVINGSEHRLCCHGCEAVAQAIVASGLTDYYRHRTTISRRAEDLGHPACLLVPDLIRAPLARLLRRAAPRLKVLGHSEIPETHSIRIGSIIGGTT